MQQAIIYMIYSYSSKYFLSHKSNCSLCSANGLEPKDIKFTITFDKDNNKFITIDRHMFFY